MIALCDGQTEKKYSSHCCMTLEELKYRAEVIYLHSYGQQLLNSSFSHLQKKETHTGLDQHEDFVVNYPFNTCVFPHDFSSQIKYLKSGKLFFNPKFASSTVVIRSLWQHRNEGWHRYWTEITTWADLQFPAFIPTPPQTWPPNPNLSIIHIFNHWHFFCLWGKVFQFLARKDKIELHRTEEIEK